MSIVTALPAGKGSRAQDSSIIHVPSKSSSVISTLELFVLLAHETHECGRTQHSFVILAVHASVNICPSKNSVISWVSSSMEMGCSCRNQ